MVVRDVFGVAPRTILQLWGVKHAFASPEAGLKEGDLAGLRGMRAYRRGAL